MSSSLRRLVQSRGAGRPPVGPAALVALVGLLATVACEPDGSSRQPSATRHPVQDRLHRPDTIPVRVSVEERAPDSSPLVGARLDSGSTIGARRKPVSEVFGEITEVASAEDRFFVLDGQANEVKVFRLDGTYEGTFGRPGQGPGEFEMPTEIGLLGRDTVVVVDRRRRIQLFGPTDSLPAYESEFRTEHLPFDACTTDRRIVVLSFAVDTESGPVDLLHVYTPSGRHVRSFGKVYSAENPLVQYKLSQGQIECDSARSRVVFASDKLPEVRVYDLDTGELESFALLTDYRPMLLQAEAGGTVTQGLPDPEGSYHYLYELSLDRGTGHAIVQLALMTMRSIEETRPYSELWTVAVPLSEGREGGRVSASLPRLLVLRRNLALTGRRLPFPRLQVHRGIGQEP